MLDDKVALVTGGSSGIGKAAAKKMAREGARVGLLARHLDSIEDAAQEIEDEGGVALPLEGDVSRPDDIKQAVDQIIEQFGRLDIVFANAGINGRWAPIEELDVEEWKKTIDVNLTGTFITLKYAVPHLKKQGGSVVVTSSINGTRDFSLSGATAYASSKAGQVALTKMLALELAPDNVRVNVICPGMVDTHIEEHTEREDLEDIQYPADYPEGTVPLTKGEAGDPEEVANLVAYLASDKASLITGTPVWIDGGQSLLMG